jgi:hypothetical protein
MPTKRSKQGKVTYFHQALLPVIVSPNHESVFSLAPEFITPQDGSEKQDCEMRRNVGSVIMPVYGTEDNFVRG